MENKLSRDVYIAYIIKVAVGFLYLFPIHVCMYVTLFHKMWSNFRSFTMLLIIIITLSLLSFTLTEV